MAYTPEQRRNIALAKRMSRTDSPRVRKALLEAMAVESNFRNLNYGDRDSLGVLQQRPSAGWKNPTNVPTAINSFLTRARRNDQGFRGTPGQLAQSVQRSAFPGRYDQRGQQASELLRSAIGGSGSSPGYSLASRLGGNGGVTGASPQQGGGYRQAVAAFLLQQSTALAQGQATDPNAMLNLAMLRNADNSTADAGASAPTNGDIHTPRNTGGGSTASGNINELFYDPLGGIKFGKQIGAIGHHSDHVHVSLSTLAAQLAAEKRARGLGLRVGQEQNSDVTRVHTPTSYHYRNFPGSKYREAADVSGNSRQMAAFYRWVARNYGK